MKNFKQLGDNVTLVAIAACASGDLVAIGAVIGVAAHDAEIGDLVTLARRGVFEVSKTSAQAWAVGDKVYFDATNKVATSVETDNTLIGTATAAADNPSSTGEVLLDGAIR